VRRADHSSRGVLPSVVCLSVIMNPRQLGGLGPLEAVAPRQKKKHVFTNVVVLIYSSKCYPPPDTFSSVLKKVTQFNKSRSQWPFGLRRGFAADRLL